MGVGGGKGAEKAGKTGNSEHKLSWVSQEKKED